MNIKLYNEAIAAIGPKKLEHYGVDDTEKSWRKFQDVYLARFGQSEIQKLLALLEGVADAKGVKTAITDCQLWLKALEGKGVKPRSVSQFESLLRHTFAEAAAKNVAEGRPTGPRLYQRDEKRGVWLSYYVSKTEYHPEKKERDSYYPAYARMALVYQEFGGRSGTGVRFEASDCLGKSVEEALAAKGFILETAELRKEYERRRDLFNAYYSQIGKQFLAVGLATDDCDGNPKQRDSSWYWSRTNNIQLDKTGEPSRVVVDLFYEDDREADRDRRHGRDSYVDRLWWHRRRSKQDEDVEGREDEGLDEVEVDPEAIPEPEIPLHPSLACFDMKRHLRLRIDVGQLTEYAYDARLGDKLILPSDSRNLVEMLLAHKGQFRDIVKGKSGGAIILCAGIPGTGKTLTAEVYAEVMARPLYTVQASQLGTDPDKLEDELLKTFARASRWNAIMLIDEADVYVHTRGNDLQQNAIVGVFLRVLEYYKGVLFLTTNRSDLVDDAIASRCVARIDYKAPIPEDQKAIWKVLATTAGISIKPSVIEEVTRRYPDLTGRDVKNLLKLAKLVSDSRECEITVDVIRFAKRFKPTVGTEAEGRDEEPVGLPPMPDREDDAPATEDDAGGTQASHAGATLVPASDWRQEVASVFKDGAPHAASEAKEAVAKRHPEVHPNAVTNAIKQLVKGGKLSRLASGLYRLEG